MRKTGIRPDAATFNIVVRMYCRTHRPREARAIIGDMLARKLAPTAATYAPIIYEYGKAGDLASILDVLAEMQRHNVDLDLRALRCVMGAVTSMGHLAAARALSDAAADVGDGAATAGPGPERSAGAAEVRLTGDQVRMILKQWAMGKSLHDARDGDVGGLGAPKAGKARTRRKGGRAAGGAKARRRVCQTARGPGLAGGGGVREGKLAMDGLDHALNLDVMGDGDAASGEEPPSGEGAGARLKGLGALDSSLVASEIALYGRAMDGES